MENDKLILTKDALIEQAKHAVPLFGYEHIPGVEIRFDKLALKIGLFTEEQFEEDAWDTMSKSWRKWTHDRDYDAKKKIFSDLGFNVVGLFVDSSKLLEFDCNNHWDEDFLIQQKDLFIVSINNNVGTYQSIDENVIFVLQYQTENRGEIAQETVDYVAVANDRQSQRELSKIFNHGERITRVDKYLADNQIKPANDKHYEAE
jgi:hypothetical protein